MAFGIFGLQNSGTNYVAVPDWLYGLAEIGLRYSANGLAYDGITVYGHNRKSTGVQDGFTCDYRGEIYRADEPALGARNEVEIEKRKEQAAVGWRIRDFHKEKGTTQKYCFKGARVLP